MLSVDLLNQVLDYNVDTGLFVWKIQSGRGRIGSVAGTKTFNGYISVHFDGKQYYAHRLAWFFVYGEWPNGRIDHINHNKIDNRIANLRIATQSQNITNMKREIRGVKKLRDCRDRYSARIWKDYKEIHIGNFGSREEAFEAYKKTSIELFGEFSPYK